MRTPFSDYTFSNPNYYTSIGNAFELESPLLDPGELEYENVELENYSYDGYIREDSEVTNIDVQKAILFNKKYQSELWGSQVSSITKYFASIGITKDALPLDANNFALAVAKWQATVFTNPKSIDGALGPISWNLLKSRINAVPAPAPAPTITRSQWHSIISNTVSSPAIPLVHGKETLRQMVAAIKTATSSDHYIYILGWMLDVDFEMIPGDKSSTLIQLLQDASKRNVEIRVLIWDSPLYIKEISNAATKINSLNNAVLIKDNATFGSTGIKSAISKIRFLLSQAPLFLRFISSWNDFVAKANTIQNEGSHHEKVLVVKGKEGLIGFCGGIDINPNRVKGVDSLGRSTVLHDIHCEVRGHAAWVLLHRFIWRWQVYKSRASWPTPKLLLVPLLGDKEPLPTAAVPGANVAQVKILQTYNHPGNNIKDRSIREAVKLAIFNAKKSVHIEDQYMISLEIASWLNNKLANEPNFSSVTILTQDDDIAGEDILFPKQMRKKFIDQLVNGLSVVNRKKIFIQMLHRSAPLTAHHKIHSKIYIIDDELAIIGSANLSSRSMTHDSETAAIIFNDPGASTNFALQLKAKMKADPDTNIISYTPNPNVKDIDVKVIDELNNLSTAKRIALAATFGPSFTLLIPQVIKTVLTQIKPALIDIIDPDADNTQPQQELEGWPETLQENNMYNESVEQEAALEELFIPSENESLENYQSEDNPQNEDETNGVYAQLEHGAEDLTFYNEQTTYVNDSYEEINNGYFPSENETAEMIENQVAIINSKPCVGLICWAKDALNKFLNVNLPINNKLDEATKKAIGDFQVKNNLPQTQKIDPTTERALLEADAIRRHKGTALDQVATKTITEAKNKIEDFTKKAVNNKPQHILNSYRDPRKVYAFVLHHMAYKRRGIVSKQYSDPSAYLSTGAHFCIMLDGRIIQLHAMSRMIWHGNCISPGSVAVEFEGNFPNIKGTWWYPTDKKTGKKIKINEDKPTQAQFDSGRFLACYLKLVLGTTHILAHRQSSDSRENDPGPDIWFNVGQWAVDKLGLSDGGPTFKCGTGNPILTEWKTWGNKTGTVINPEFDESTGETEWTDSEYENKYESELDQYYEEEEESIMDEDTAIENFDEETNTFNYLESEVEPVTTALVPFAPLPPSVCYWPLISNVSEGRLVSYTSIDGYTIGSTSRKFLANRVTSSGEGRNHVAIDLYADFNDPVVAVDDGIILSFKHFYTTKGGNDTNCLIVQHSNVIVNYGEVGPSSFPRLGLKVGDTVRAGQVIAFVGATQMLHFETYKITGSSIDLPPHRWMKADGHPPASLYNPTKYLLYLKQYGLTGSSSVSTPATTTTTSVPISAPIISAQWANAIRLNRYYQNTLGWIQYYDKINDFLLPYSGQQNVSLDEESFAYAIAVWQQQLGFAAKDCDGIIGPTTWAKLKLLILTDASSTQEPVVTTTASSPASSASATSATSGIPPQNALGKLTIDTSISELAKSNPEYQFTPDDAIWLARFVEGEAGGQDNSDSHAVIWAMFNRFGIFRHKHSASWSSLGRFLRLYSTTLQSLLNSAGAAERVWYNYNQNPSKYPIVSSEETYPGTIIKKVQYLRHIKLQNKKWDEFAPYVRNMIIKILTGKIPNPGIGIATDFDSSYILLKAQRRKKNIYDEPSQEEWRRYTIQHAAAKKMFWIDEQPNLNQKKNAYYGYNFLKDVPPDAVKVVFQTSSTPELYDESYEAEMDNVGYEFSPVDTEDLTANWSNAINQNRNYSTKLGWGQYHNQINDLLLPYSGLQNVSLSEEDFAHTLAVWQQQQGLTADGILGPKTWANMQTLLSVSTPLPVYGNTGPTRSNTQAEWAANPGIKARYPNWQLYDTIRNNVIGWGISNPASYIENAIQEWNANPGVQRHFGQNFDGDPQRSYLNLNRLYQAKGVTNPANYFASNIVPISFFNRSTSGHINLRSALNHAQSNLISGGHNFNLASAWSFVPRTFNNNINKLSNHALGKAIDINPSVNPHIVSNEEILVINTVCRSILPVGLLAESNPDILKLASDYFRSAFNSSWINQQTQSSVISAIQNKRSNLDKYATNGFLNLPSVFIRALQSAGLVWGGAWRSSKDFMHFELP